MHRNLDKRDSEQPKAERHEKHTEIAMTIENLYGVLEHVSDLLEQVTTGSLPETVATKFEYAPHSLAEFLSTAPSTIQEAVTDIHAKLDELKSLLF